MRKLLLMSLLLMTFGLPMFTARDPSAVRGLRRTILGMTAFVVFYVLALVYVFPHLG